MEITEALSQESKEERHARSRRRYAAGGLSLGAVCAAFVGALAAGLPGAIVGAVIGAVMGGMTGWAMQSASEVEAKRDSQLDVEIGVTGGDLGVEGLEHPPAKIGALSKEAAGAEGSTEPHTASGPFVRPPE
jgi:hypothetical protein